MLNVENKVIAITGASRGSDISDEASKGFLQELRKTALTPDAIARAVLYAVAQLEDEEKNESDRH